MEIGDRIIYSAIMLHGVITEILPVRLPYRPKPLYRVTYSDGRTGILEEKDFILDSQQHRNNE